MEDGGGAMGSFCRIDEEADCVVWAGFGGVDDRGARMSSARIFTARTAARRRAVVGHASTLLLLERQDTLFIPNSQLENQKMRKGNLQIGIKESEAGMRVWC